MKRLKLQPVLVLVCFVFCNFTAIEEASSEELYRQAMKETLNKMDSAARADDLLQCRNQFERISMKYTGEWLPVYYIAYCDIQLVYYNPKSPGNPKHLADAKERLDNLYGYPQADASNTTPCGDITTTPGCCWSLKKPNSFRQKSSDRTTRPSKRIRTIRAPSSSARSTTNFCRRSSN